MIEFVDAALGAAGVGVVAAAAGIRRYLKARRDERAQVIAMGEGMGIEYVPGEDFDEFRKDVCRARNSRANAAHRKWLEETEREQKAERARDAKGRFV